MRIVVGVGFHWEVPEEAVVIGAGVIGCAIALELQRNGYAVTVVDKGPAAGAGSTSSSSAIVRFHYSTLDGVIAAWEAMHIWRSWAAHVGVEDESGLARLYQCGILVIDPPGDRAERVLALFDQVGVPYERFDADALEGRLQALDAGCHFPPKAVTDEAFWSEPNGSLGAYLTPDGGFVDDPQLAAHNLMVAAKHGGATFRFNTAVTSIERRGGRVRGVMLDDGARLAAGIVINAAGPWSSKINELAGVLDDFATTGTRALRQEVHVVPAPPGFALDEGGVVVNDSDLGTYFRPHPGGTIIVGGLEPECDPLVWVDDPDGDWSPRATPSSWEAQVFRLARRLPGLAVPNRPTGLAALYDVTPDWVPVYDRTSLDGFYVAIGTSGNQFKNAPLVGRILAHLIDACEGGHDHDASPVIYPCPHTGWKLDLGHYSRNRKPLETTHSVLG